MFAPLSSSTIAAPSTINFINYSGYFPCSPLAASLVSDHIPWKCGIWKHEDYHINIHSILTSNVFLVISIHIQSCGSDFWKYLLLFSPSNSPELTGLSKFAQFDHILLHESIPRIEGLWKLAFQAKVETSWCLDIKDCQSFLTCLVLRLVPHLATISWEWMGEEDIRLEVKHTSCSG